MPKTSVDDKFLTFYRSYIEEVCQNINKGKVTLIVGINSIGKTLLSSLLLKEKFQREFLPQKKVKFIFLGFKDKNPPNPQQLYRYWLTKTAEAIGFPLPESEVINDFAFHFYLGEMTKQLEPEEKVVFVVLDAQNILNQGETFFRTLIYLNRYTYGKVTHIFLSEPQILECKNIWARRFVQDLVKNKFLFLKLFDRKTILLDIQREAEFLQTGLTDTQKKLVTKYSGGLHGVIGAITYLLKNNPQIHSGRQLRDLISTDLMFQYWIEDILSSLPFRSQVILKEVAGNPGSFRSHAGTIYGRWLVDLGFIRQNGLFRHPLLLPIVKKFTLSSQEVDHNLKYIGNTFRIGREVIKLTKKEKVVLARLFSAKGHLVSYDDLGEVLFSNNPDKYSLWAISQIVYRLKKKLGFYSINPDIISTRRGEGYVLN